MMNNMNLFSKLQLQRKNFNTVIQCLKTLLGWRSFDPHEKFRRPTNTKTRSSSLVYKDVNLNTEQDPKNINLGKNCTHVERTTFMKLFREFKDVFAWTYEGLKTYDTKIIQHVIPLKEDAKPFQQKTKKDASFTQAVGKERVKQATCS